MCEDCELGFIKQLTGEISYNGYKLEEFVPQKTSAYISQYDVHIPDMTVREVLDFSARCQGVGSRAGTQIPFHHHYNNLYVHKLLSGLSKKAMIIS